MQKYRVVAMATVESDLPPSAILRAAEFQLSDLMEDNQLDSSTLRLSIDETLTPEQEEENLRAVLNGAEQGPHQPSPHLTTVPHKRPGLLARLTGSKR